MKNKKQTIAIIAVGLLLVVAIIGGVAKPSLSAKLNDNADKVPVPDFIFTNADGEDVNFNDLKGKPIVMNFWATWCTFCVLEMEDFDNLSLDYSDDVNFIIMDMVGSNGETVQKAIDFLNENNHNNIVPYFDSYNHARTIFGVQSLPMTLFIDEDGNLYDAILQMTSYEEVEAVILEMLGK